MTILKCDIKAIDDALQGTAQAVDDAKKADINRRIDSIVRRLEAVSATAEEAKHLTPEVRNYIETQFKNIMNVANTVYINPNAGRGLGHMLATTFGMNKAGIGLLDKFTDSGSVQYMLETLRRRGGGEVHDILAQMTFIDNAIEADKILDKLRRRLGINRKDFAALRLDAYEIGFHPYLQRDLGIVGPEGIAFLQGRQKRFYDRLKQYGFTQEDANILARQVTKVSNSFREVLEIVRLFGVKSNDADGLIRYLPRSFSPETLRRFGWSRNADKGVYDILTFDGPRKESFPSVFTKSRNSDIFLVEDKILLDEVLRGSVSDIYEQLGVSGVDELLEDTSKLARSFVDHIDRVKPEVFDALVDSGIISKIPMTSNELFEYAKARYKLPFKAVDEFMGTDFRAVTQLYRNQLEKLVGRSIMSHFTVKAAVDGGWGITEAQKLADPDTYRGWVKLSSPDPRNGDVVITATEAQRFGIPTFQNAAVYVHPVVADLFKAQTQVLSNPNQLSILARIANDLRSTFGAQALFTSGFVFRQLYTPVFQIWAAGGDILSYGNTLWKGLSQLAALKAKGLSLDRFAEAFDDTRKIYDLNGTLVSERELWHTTRRRGITEEVIPWLGAPVESANFKPFARVSDSANPLQRVTEDTIESMRRQLRYMGDVLEANNLGPPGSVQAFYKAGEIYDTAAEGFRRVNERWFYGVSAANVFYDNMARFALIKSLTDTSALGKLTRSMQGNFPWKGPLPFEEAVQQAENYFFRYDNPGSADRFIRHIRPFWMFQSRNTFAIFRMMVRNPGRFMAYQRLFAALNRPKPGEEEVPNGAMRDWLRDTAPLYWVDEEGENLMVLPRSMFDPVAEGTNAVTEIFDGAMDALGVWPARSNKGISDRIEDLPWKDTQTNSALRSIFEESMGYQQALLGYILGEDVRTGRKLRGENAPQMSTFLGVEVTPMIRYIAETTFPTLRNVNRSNPLYMFGRPPKFDDEGNLIDMGTPSWAGVYRDERDSASDFREWWQRSLAAVGFNVYSLNILEEMGYRRTEIEIALGQGREAIQKKQIEIESITHDRHRTERALQELMEMKALYAALEIDYNNVLAWAEERNMSYPGAIRYLRNNNIRIESLDSLPPEEAVRILERIYGPQFNGEVGLETLRRNSQ